MPTTPRDDPGRWPKQHEPTTPKPQKPDKPPSDYPTDDDEDDTSP